MLHALIHKLFTTASFDFVTWTFEHSDLPTVNTIFAVVILTFIDATSSYLPVHGTIMYSDNMSVCRMCHCYLIRCMALYTVHSNCDTRVFTIVQVNTYLQS
jgi:hypothetical protein